MILLITYSTNIQTYFNSEMNWDSIFAGHTLDLVIWVP